MALVEIRDLVVAYGDHAALKGVDLDVAAHKLTAVVGPSGCGKTSLLRAIAGFEVPRAGTVRIAGRPVAGPGIWVPPEERRVGMVFQQGALFPHLTVWQNLCYGLRRRQDVERVERALALVGLAGLRQRYPDELSGGEQQRVALARALVPSPRLILLDEPFASLDAGLRQHLRAEVRAILERARMTAVLVTHDQEEALSVADEVVVMGQGRVLQVGSPDAVYRHPASLAVAAFLGDGQLIACEVEGHRARSSLGTVPSNGARPGPGLLLVRPEDLVLAPADAPGGLPGHIARRTFYGHDLIDEVVLDDGAALQVRRLSADPQPVGSAVRVQLRDKPFPVYPDPQPAGRPAVTAL
ncbi:MAG: ABC transporter ATP-binding protein [Acidobacteria bacterium]|nr:MAG: ABC transporter ATP-binding protein [Acidobacteriota bacterium]